MGRKISFSQRVRFSGSSQSRLKGKDVRIPALRENAVGERGKRPIIVAHLNWERCKEASLGNKL